MVTRVVSLHDRSPAEVVYVGPPMPAQGLKGHLLASPFPPAPAATREDRRIHLAKYETWLLTWNPEKLWREIPALAAEVWQTGKPLGCWCGNYPDDLDLACHAVALAKRIDALEESLS
jgi:hypothetical protein